jgi:putative addiction module CopG family antidote
MESAEKFISPLIDIDMKIRMNISVELTGNLLEYLDSKVRMGYYKSGSEVVRQAIREMIQQDLAGQLEAKGITMDDIESLREEVSVELVKRKYDKKPKIEEMSGE